MIAPYYSKTALPALAASIVALLCAPGEQQSALGSPRDAFRTNSAERFQKKMRQWTFQFHGNFRLFKMKWFSSLRPRRSSLFHRLICNSNCEIFGSSFNASFQYRSVRLSVQ